MRGKRLSFSLRVSLLYALAGGLWILFSDRIVQATVKDPNTLSLVQTYKGWFYVAVTAVILFIVLREEIQSRETAEERYKNIVENAVTGVFQSTPEGRYLSVNPAMAEMYGYASSDEMIASVTDIGTQIHFSPAERKRFVNLLMQNGSVEKFEAQNYRKDRSIIWTSTSGRVVRDNRGNILYFEGFVQDITHQKYAEQALRESEWGFRGLYQNNPLMLFTLDEKGIILAVNQTGTDRLGYEAEELFGQSIEKVLHEEDKNKIIRPIQESLEHLGRVLRLEFRQVCKDGSVLWIDATMRVVKDAHEKINIFVVCQDITERKKAELDLRLAEARYRALVEQVPAAVYTEMLDAEGTKLYVSPQIQTITGYTAQEWLERPRLWLEILHPKDKPAILKEDDRTRHTLETFQVEYRIIAKDGQIKWVRDQAVLIRDEAGNPLHWQGILLDISEQRRVEETIRQSEERFGKVFQSSPIAICITTWNEAVYIDANPAYLSMSEYGPEELIGKSVFEFGFFSPEKRTKFLERMRKEKFIRGEEDTFITKSGKTLDVLTFYETIVLNGQECILSMFHNITEQKHAQTDLARREAILNAIAFAADQFLKSSSWTNNITSILKRIGAAADASRVYIFKKQPSPPDQIIASQLFEWSAPGISPQIDNPRLQHFDMMKDDLKSWADRFALGEPAYGLVRDLPAAQQVELIKEEILSIICVPIMIEENWWGFIGLDDCVTEHQWSESEIEALQTASNILSAAIRRESATEAVQKQLNELMMLHAAASTNSTASTLDELVTRTTEIIGNALHPYNHGVLLLSEDKQTLLPHPSYRGNVLYDVQQPLSVSQGVAGKVVSSGKAIRLADVSAAPEFMEVAPDVRSELCVPIISGSQIVGVINLESKQQDAFTETDERLLTTIAGGLGTAIDKLKLFEAERRQVEEAENLREATTALTKILDLPTLLEQILDLLPTFAKFDSASVILNNNGNWEIVAGRGLPDGLIGKQFDESSYLHQVSAEHKPLIISDAQHDSRFQIIPGTEYIRSWMGVPMIASNKIIGFLNIDSRIPDAFTLQQATYVRTFANQAAIAIQNASSFAAEQNQRIREASMLDLMRVAASSLDLDEVIETILSHLMNLIHSDTGTIQLIEESRLRILAAIGFPPDAVKRGNTLIIEDFPLNAEIIKNKQPLRIDDVTQDSRYRWLPGIEDNGSFLGIPIIYKDTVIGIATLDSQHVGHFTEPDQELALGIANHAANAIANARLYELEQQRRQEAENLRIAAAAITSSLDSDQVLDTILIALKQVVPYDSATMFLLEGERVRVTAAQGLPSLDSTLNQTFPANNKLLLAIQEKRGPEILYDAQVDSRFEHWAAADEVRGWMGVPLIARGDVIGYITLDSYKVGAFDENSAALAQTFAYQAAIAIDNSRLFEQTKERLEELEIVSRVSFALRATQNPEHMLHILMKEILNLIGTDAASVWLYDANTNELFQNVASGWHSQIGLQRMGLHTGIIGHVYQTGAVHIIDEFSRDEYTHPNLKNRFGLSQGGVAVPIRSTDKVIGALIITVPLPRKIESHQVQLLTTIAEIAGSAIHRAQLYEQSEEQVQRLIALRDVDIAISSSFDLRVTLSILLEHILNHLKVDATSVLSYNTDLRTLNRISDLGFRQLSNLQSSIRITNRLLSTLLLERKDVRILDLRQENDFHNPGLIKEEKFISYYATPLISKGQVKGILEVYLRQPMIPDADWIDFFHTMAGQAAIAIDNSQLFDNLQRTNQELSLAYDTTLEGWGKALELRDKETQGHTVRVTDLTIRLARRLGVSETDLVHIRRGVLLHDIGKMAIPDQILKKTGPLNEDEWAEMRQHPRHAYELLYPISYLRPVLDIPYCHHEHWDGSGYPRGLKGEDIPLSARIFAVVDVWDALLFDRPYRKAWSRDNVIEYMKGQSGTHFDPKVLQEFLEMMAEDETKTG